MFFRQLDLVLQQRFAGDGNHRLGQIAEPCARPRARAAGEDDKLARHQEFFTSATISPVTARSTAWFEVSRGDQPSFFNFSTE